MKAGEIFTLDDQAVQEIATFTKTPLVDVQKKCAAGDVYSVAKSETGTGEVVRGSRWVDGKPRKGRPRSFPRATVQRLLGEEFTPAAEVVEVEAEKADDMELEAHAAELLTPTEEAATADTW